MKNREEVVEKLRASAREMLSNKTVDVVIGWGCVTPEQTVATPVFVKSPDDVELLDWNEKCYGNLAAYMTRKEVRALGRVALMVKGCDEKALVVLRRESQIDPSNPPRVIGIACDEDGLGCAKCGTCDVHVPRFADIVISGVTPVPENVPVPAEKRYERLSEFMKQPRENRLAFWMKEFDRCIRCYACRQVCPLCYCERCIAERNKPQAIDSSATPRGNWSWGITRAFHLAGRCIGCGECTRVCPAEIDLSLLNLSLANAAERSFEGFRPGMDPDREGAVGAYSRGDSEEFIR
ncbi:hypothetical protein GX645_03990 [Candidatus Sumerlaeota bacterium]|nr:4Fe-4S dicluster domain-containing protein [Candidatus Sumerlaeales bacterium]NLD61593.1 hypothetical protein [Candidatus Sumerlaeota bacterium]